jgi:hypothetical protein
MRLRHSRSENGEEGFTHWCPACDGPHYIRTARPRGDEKNQLPLWTFNGNMNSPTFSPSVLCYTVPYKDGKPIEPQVRKTLCHYFITAGMIAFCGDNPHKLNAQTVPLPEWPADA